MSYTNNHHIEANAVQRVASLPLFDSALKTVVSVYMDVKGRYPLLSVVGGVAEIGVRNVSQAAILRATPLLLSLEPQIEVVNNYACMGLDQLEKNFPVLHQSTEEVLGHLKDAFFLTLDDVQLRVNDELDGMQGRWDKLTDVTWYYLLALQESQLGQMATSGLDDILTRSEEAMAKYMPLTATLRLEWERRTQQYEDEDGEDEPGLWTRFRGLLLCLSLQLYHRLLKLRNRLERAMGMLQDATDRLSALSLYHQMGLSRLLEVVSSVLQMLKLFYVSQVLRLEAMRRLALDQLKAQVRVLAELGPINQLLGLPAQVQLVVADLQELGKILLQLLVKSTPLYNMS
ncbi:perilipin 6 [Oncorhynchus kisutch]|uniref:perilipin 6 n=1 Tax=Oncorhynchus kisutch TaxID=8019 RepID=UPI0012DFD60B|nr:perilipin-2-like [Oncorhynchus kisutch]